MEQMNLAPLEAGRAETALPEQADAEKALRAFRSLSREVTAGNAGKARSFCFAVVEEYWRYTYSPPSSLDSALIPCPVAVEPLTDLRALLPPDAKFPGTAADRRPGN